jgi:hypothetical protein
LKAKYEQPIQAAMAEEKLMAMNRRERRHAVVKLATARTGMRTGTTPHFALWMADLKQKSALQKLKLNKLIEHLPDQEHGVLAPLRACHVAGIKSVWDLSQTKPNAKGIGPKRLAEIEAYLKSKDIPLKWTANA